jgi:hypothetical protein
MEARSAVIFRHTASHSEFGMVFYTITAEQNDDDTWTAYGHAFGYIHAYPVSYVGPWHYVTLDEAKIDIETNAVTRLVERLGNEIAEPQIVQQRRARCQHQLHHAVVLDWRK